MINLLPPELRQEYRAARLNTKMRNYIVLLLVVLIICVEIAIYGFMSINTEYKLAEASLANNTAQVARLSETAAEVESLSKKVSGISKLFDKRLSYAALIQEIAKSTPSGAYLTQLNVDVQNIDKQPVSLVFRAKSQQVAAVLRNNFDENGLFKDIDIQSVIKSDESSSNDSLIRQYPFEVTISTYLDRSKLESSKL